MPNATLVNSSGQTQVVPVGSPQAQQYFAQGYQLQGAQPNNPNLSTNQNNNQSTPNYSSGAGMAGINPSALSPLPGTTANPSGSPYGGATQQDPFYNFMGSMLTTGQSMNNLQAQKTALLNQLYTIPGQTPSVAGLNPNQIAAIQSGNQDLINYQIGQINNVMAGKSTADTNAMDYAIQGYQADVAQYNTQYTQAQQKINDSYTNLTNLANSLGPELTNLSSADIASIATGNPDQNVLLQLSKAQTLNEKLQTVNGVTGYVNDQGAFVQVPLAPDGTPLNTTGVIADANGNAYDPTGYADDMGSWSAAINGILSPQGGPKLKLDDSTLPTYLQQNLPNSNLTAQDFEQASAATGVDYEPIVAIAQHESTNGTSNVEKIDNNAGGITWNPDQADPSSPYYLPGASEGSARSPGEGGNYTKFENVGQSLVAIGKILSRSKVGAAGSTTTSTTGSTTKTGLGYPVPDYSNVPRSLQGPLVQYLDTGTPLDSGTAGEIQQYYDLNNPQVVAAATAALAAQKTASKGTNPITGGLGYLSGLTSSVTGNINSTASSIGSQEFGAGGSGSGGSYTGANGTIFTGLPTP